MVKTKPEVTQDWIERQSRATPVLFLDLDGTVRHGKDELGFFANNASQVKVFPEVPVILKEYKRNGWRVVAITNQGGVALGYFSDQDCMAMMVETQSQCDGAFDQMHVCMHHPDAPDPEYAVCWCRKPRIGGLILATMAMAQHYNEYYPPHLALLVGDREEDRQCAENAGVRFMDAKEWRSGGWKYSPAPIGGYTLNESQNVQ